MCVVIGSTASLAMASESVSFRITRNAEDLAETIHALSHRLVRLEQRLAAVELQLDRSAERDPQEISSLDNVERLLTDCRHLLEMAPAPTA
jgi:prefoldin subunit 5